MDDSKVNNSDEKINNSLILANIPQWPTTLEALQQKEIIDNEVRLRAQNFLRLLHKNPDSNDIRINSFANNSKYLPISFLEMNLDEMFFGAWQTTNFQYKVVANEIIGSIELSYLHPTLNIWITRIGAGSVMIQYEAQYEELPGGKKKKIKTNITDISLKITNTLSKDFPHLKAECFRNACLSIGKSFGRDLNREFQDQYQPILKKETNLTDAQIKIIDTTKIQIDDFTNEAELLSKKDNILKSLKNQIPEEEIKEIQKYIQAKYDQLKKGK